MLNRIQIPIFPLNTVLFPGQILPLHIFEDRYQEMMRDILGGEGLFGVVLIKQGTEVGEPAEPYDVGTIARVKQVDRLNDGRINLLCVGEERFRIIESNQDKPYLAGTVEYWPWDFFQDDEMVLRQDNLRTLLSDYLEILSNLVGSRLVYPNTPEDPLILACVAGFILRITDREKQQLLTTTSVMEFQEACIQVLRREISTLRMTGSIPDIPDDGSITFTPN